MKSHDDAPLEPAENDPVEPSGELERRDEPEVVALADEASSVETPQGEHEEQEPVAQTSPSWKKARRIVLLALLVTLIVLGAVAAYMIDQEHKTSAYQADYFVTNAEPLTYTIEEGEELKPDSLKRLKPPEGPRNKRLGYTLIEDAIAIATERGFDVTLSATPSPELEEYVHEAGFFPPYREKMQAGLKLMDSREEVLVEKAFPQYIYDSYDEIPPLVTRTIFFLENREMMEPKPSTYNYVLEWDRTLKSFWMLAKKKLFGGAGVHGGSTLATQWEKFSHSDGGQTQGAKDKLRQIYSASMRLYGLHGENTELGRQAIALYYLNQFPLGARPNLGELHGLRDGLYDWFGLDPNEADAALRGERDIQAQGHALRHVTGLLIGLRRPSALLAGDDLSELSVMVEEALATMHHEGVIDEQLYEHAANLSEFEPVRVPEPRKPTPEQVQRQKAIDSMRAALASALGLESQHDLERVDVTARSTLDQSAQLKVEDLLVNKMRDPQYLAEQGFLREHGLSEDDDPSDVQYSFMLFEREDGFNKVRLEVDTLQKPFNFNRGARVDLGSTSKLRTLVTYLELVADLYDRWRPLSREELLALELNPRDRIAQWAQQELYRDQEMTKAELVEEALQRKYPAYPARFMTGGGMHVFHNFSKDTNGWNPDMRLATRKSINLPFIRLMQDLVFHYRWSKVDPGVISDRQHPERQAYLMKWINQDVAKYLARYDARYDDIKRGDEALARLIERHHDDLTPTDYITLYRYFVPDITLERTRALIDEQLVEWRRPILEEIDADEWQYYFDRAAPGELTLQDRGAISEVHPLEIWVVKRHMEQPDISRERLTEELPEVVPDIYAWLIDSKSKRRQDNKIYTILEQDAFEAIQDEWARMGYPFEDMVPSLASAIGASADRPSALSTLMGMIMAEGKRYPVSRIQEISLASGTPYALKLRRQQGQGEQVLDPEVARATRDVMELVVTRGTAVRARSLRDEYLFRDLVGKTGTGDHTLEHVTASGRRVDGEAVSRAGVFMFGFGERFFGVLTIYVEGQEAADYDFTSSMAAQVFTQIAPMLSDMVANPAAEPEIESTPSLAVDLKAEDVTLPKHHEPNQKPMLAGVIDPVVDGVLLNEGEEGDDSEVADIITRMSDMGSPEAFPVDEHSEPMTAQQEEISEREGATVH